MRVSLGVTTSMPINESIELVRVAEANDYHRVWVGEDILSREIFTYLSILANKTNRIRLGSGITSPFARNISLIANGAAGVQLISDDRFTLGLGVGGLPEVEKLTGERPGQPLRVMRESTDLLRRILDGEKVFYSDGKDCLDAHKLYTRPDALPGIYFGARGPKMLHLAGETADGVILSGPRGYLPRAISLIGEGARSVGRNPDDVDLVLWNNLMVIEDERDLNRARTVAATILASLPTSMREYLEIGPELVEHIKRAFKREDYRRADEYVEEDVLEELCVAGSPREIRWQIEEYEEMGFDEFVVGPPYARDPARAVEALYSGGG